ncbi:MAG TPA: hypothetical protein VHU85_01380 [Acidimicrobiales bacterium]|jgi:hypothetical protein|nr:hypothetical protein [Acidimicrobiales bacterium]
MDDDRTVPNQATDEAERVDEQFAHGNTSRPVPEDDAAADKAREQFKGDEEQVAEHYKEMVEKGAHVKGEGEI